MKGELASDKGERKHYQLEDQRLKQTPTKEQGLAQTKGVQCHFTMNKAQHGTQGASASEEHFPGDHGNTGAPEVVHPAHLPSEEMESG